MIDPFPGQELLDRDQVQRLMGMERSTFARWLASDSADHFPKPVQVGKTPKGRAILKWKKSKVIAFIDLLGAD